MDTYTDNRNLKRVPLCKAVLVALLVVQTSLLAYLSWTTSPNRTEVGHLGATVYFWNYGKFDVFHVNPPLVRMVAGAPVALFCSPKYDWTGYSPRPQDRCEWKLGNAFIAANELDNLRCYVFLMRVACTPFVLLGGYFGFRFASELYGEWSGVIFAALWTFSPLVLGWGATICPDVAAASMGIIGLYTFWHWLKNPVWRKAAIAGSCLGLMPLTKTTWIIAFPIWLILWGVWLFSKRNNRASPPLRQFATIALLGIFTINVGYFFDGSFHSLNKYQFASGTLTGNEIAKGKSAETGNRFADSLIGYVPVLLPAEFVQGIDTQKLDFERGIESFAHGVWSDHGWWWYYVYALMLKEPLGVWGLTLLAITVSCLYRTNNAPIRDELTFLIPLLLVFAFISSQTGFSLHTRYAILILPFLYIFISKIANQLSQRRIVAPVLAAAGIAWVVGSSLWHYPHSMSYFNELAGGPKKWPACLLGSNVEWGQELYELREWVFTHQDYKPLFITVAPTIPTEKLLPVHAGIVPHKRADGWMVLSVNELFGQNKKYAWLHESYHISTIGTSMWVFYIPPQETNDREARFVRDNLLAP